MSASSATSASFSKRRVVVTGLGGLCPLGNDCRSTWSALLSGASGIAPVSRFDTEKFSVRIAGEVKNFAVTDYIGEKQARHMDVFIHFGVAAGMQAFADAGLAADNYIPERVGVAIGSGIGGLKSIEDTHTVYQKSGPRRISPFFIPSTIINMIAGHLSIKYNLKGPNVSLVSACTTGAHNIGDSFRMITYGDADVMLCGGSEASITPLGLGSFAAARALSASHNDSPTLASRPFDRDRDGFVLGEGAGVLVLEELEHAKKRSANIYAEVVGYGMSADAFHITAPLEDGAGAAQCMTNALANAQVNAGDIGYVNAHGTSTPLGDVAETKAIKTIFGDKPTGLAVSSTKSMTGHLLGAAGGIEAIFSVQAIAHGAIPPTINLDNPDPECDLDYTPHTARDANLQFALCNSFGFGGTNASLLFKKFA